MLDAVPNLYRTVECPRGCVCKARFVGSNPGEVDIFVLFFRTRPVFGVRILVRSIFFPFIPF